MLEQHAHVKMAESSFTISAEAKAAPHNDAAVLGVEFTAIAEKEALSYLYAFCTFLGKIHEAGALSSWPSSEESGPNRGRLSNVNELHSAETRSEGESGQLALVSCELQLPPFSVPASFCEHLINELITITVVRVTEVGGEATQNSQRKEAQSKCPGKPEGREKGAKKGAAPRPTIPQGDTRTAEMPAARFLLLKDGEKVQMPTESLQSLSSLPGERAEKRPSHLADDELSSPLEAVEPRLFAHSGLIVI